MKILSIIWYAWCFVSSLLLTWITCAWLTGMVSIEMMVSMLTLVVVVYGIKRIMDNDEDA